MPQPWTQYPGDPARDAVAVTPSDATNLTYVTRALYVGVTGDVVAVMQSGAVVTFKAAPVGVLPICVSRVNATGTTATNILALY